MLSPLCMAQLTSAMMNCGPSLKPLKNLSICLDTAIKGAIVFFGAPTSFLRTTTILPTMPRLATVLSILLILVLVETSPDQSLGGENEIKPADAVIKALSGKALIEVQDYDYGGANPRHDPRRGRPGNGGKIP